MGILKEIFLQESIERYLRFFLTLIIIFVVKIINKKKNKNGSFSEQWVNVPDNSQDIIAAIKKYDTSFSPEIFCNGLKRFF